MGNHRSSVDSPHNGPVMRILGASLIGNPKQAAAQTVGLLVLLDTLPLMWRHYNENVIKTRRVLVNNV